MQLTAFCFKNKTQLALNRKMAKKGRQASSRKKYYSVKHTSCKTKCVINILHVFTGNVKPYFQINI